VGDRGHGLKKRIRFPGRERFRVKETGRKKKAGETQEKKKPISYRLKLYQKRGRFVNGQEDPRGLFKERKKIKMEKKVNPHLQKEEWG